jgi:hypothetical protein
MNVRRCTSKTVHVVPDLQYCSDTNADIITLRDQHNIALQVRVIQGPVVQTKHTFKSLAYYSINVYKRRDNVIMGSQGTETEPLLQEVLTSAAEVARAAADKSKFDFALPHLFMNLTWENLPPVMYLKAAGEGLFATLLLSWIITLIVHPKLPQQAIHSRSASASTTTCALAGIWHLHDTSQQPCGLLLPTWP